MRISFFTKLFPTILMLLLFAIGIMVFQAFGIRNDIAISQEHRYRSLLLARELLQSSEDLTRMARTYVITEIRFTSVIFLKYSTSAKASSRVHKTIPQHIGILRMRIKILWLGKARPFLYWK